MDHVSGSMAPVTPLTPRRGQGDRIRRATGWSLVAVAGFLTAFAARIGYEAATDPCSSCGAFGWLIAGVVGLAALVGWVIAIAVFRTTGWAMYVVAGVFVVVAAAILSGLLLA